MILNRDYLMKAGLCCINPPLLPLPQINDKIILNNISGSLEPKTLTAVMGPSGCGKSSLLDILAFRGRGQSTKNVSGKISVNQAPRGVYWKRISAYVEQFDALFPHLTVREMLKYTAELRCVGDASKITSAVDRVLKDLELEHVANTMIGDRQIKGISGGQARRVTVGLELLASPVVLFLDECTTGLDSTSAKTLIETLKRLIQSNGCTIVCTIHQPRSSTFRLFDNLILLKGGEMAYFGPIKDIALYLKENLNVVVPKGVNLADFIVDMTYDKEEVGPRRGAISDGSNASAITRKDTTDALIAGWKSPNAKKPIWAGSVLSNYPSASSSSKELNDFVKGQGFGGDSRFTRSLPQQVEILLRRSYLNMSRNRGLFAALGLQNIQYLFYGLLFLGLRINVNPSASSTSFVQNGGPSGTNSSWLGTSDLFQLNLFKRNFLYQVMNTVCIVESVVIASAFLEKSIFLREHAAGGYSVAAYHAAWYIRLTCDAIWKGFLASLLSYFFPPMRMEPDAFFFFAAVQMVTSTLGSSLAFLMASAVSNAEGAANIHNTVIGFAGTYAGFFLPSLLIPIFTLWTYYLSFSKYSFEALELNEWNDCASYMMRVNFLSLDMTLTRWTNLLVLMAYPVIFHLGALYASYSRTSSGADVSSSSGDDRPGLGNNAAAVGIAFPAISGAANVAIIAEQPDLAHNVEAAVEMVSGIPAGTGDSLLDVVSERKIVGV